MFSSSKTFELLLLIGTIAIVSLFISSKLTCASIFNIGTISPIYFSIAIYSNFSLNSFTLFVFTFIPIAIE